MPKKATTKVKIMTPSEQHARFVEAAKNAEADETPDALDRAFGKIRIEKPAITESSESPDPPKP